MRPSPRPHQTDRQQYMRAGQRPAPLKALPLTDKTRLHQAPRTSAVHKPVVVTQNTLLVRGANGSQCRITFGDGNTLSVIDLTHHHFNYDIGNHHLELTGILPDCIGLDFNAGASVGPASVLGGVNVLLNLRGEEKWYIPEIYVYGGGSFSSGVSVALPSMTPTGISIAGGASVSLFLAWATVFDDEGHAQPAKSDWVANGFNWTGTFWSVGISVPTPWGMLVGSYFSSDIRQLRHLLNKRIAVTSNTVWSGVSLGLGKSVPKSAALPTELFDLAKVVLKTSSVSIANTDYSLIYGNGRDRNMKVPGEPSIDGVHGIRKGKHWWDVQVGINQNNY
jgi:hypothetical protein